MAVTAAMVKELREMTGAGMMDCKKALAATDGDMDKAVEFLREKGLAGAEKKAGRIAAEGIVATAMTEDEKKAVVVEVNAETDFVAKNAKFQAYVAQVAAQALTTTAADMDAFMEEKWAADETLTVKEALSSQISIIGENMNIRRFKQVVEENGVVVSYIHAGGRIGVLVDVETSVVNDAVKEMGKNIAMQIAALNPKYTSRDEVSADFIEHEKSILMAQIQNDPKEASKPEKVIQGMIQGRSNFVYRVVGTNKFVSLGLKDQYKTQEIHVDVNIVRNDILDLDAFRAWRPEFKDAEFILEEGRYVCGWAIEKMSKSMFNVVNPDYIVDNYGADTLRMYEMFLGPLEQSKPWDTNGIDGVHKFLRRFWALFYNREGQLILTDEKATDKELKTLHKTIKKVREDIENFSFNTSVAAFMICLNELGGCPKREILEPLTVLLAPFAPHIAEELWHTLGHTTSVCDAQYPVCEEKYLVESSFEYPVSVNGKLRFKKEYALTLSPADIQADIVRTDEAQKWLEGKAPKKIIVVPGKIINIVI